MNKRAKKLISYLLARLTEPTSWAGVGIVLAWFGLQLSLEEISYITGVGAGLAGLVLYLYPEYKSTDKPKE
jgi:hypothetical protein